MWWKRAGPAGSAGSAPARRSSSAVPGSIARSSAGHLEEAKADLQRAADLAPDDIRADIMAAVDNVEKRIEKGTRASQQTLLVRHR